MKSSRPALVALGALLLVAAPRAWAQEVKGRVVVLGFDGADHRLVSQLIAEGKLPNLQKLATEGSFSPLRPTIPAQTPVSWSTFSTGLSPGRTQIFDFLKRDPKTYRPEFAVATEGKRNFLLGRGNRAGAAAVGALLAFLVVFALGPLHPEEGPAGGSRRPRPRGAGRLLLVAVRSSPSGDAPDRPQQPAGDPVLGGRRGEGDPVRRPPRPGHLPGRGLRRRAPPLRPRRPRREGPDRDAELLHVGPLLRAEEQERVLRRARPPRVERRDDRHRGLRSLQQALRRAAGHQDPDDAHGPPRRRASPDRAEGERARRPEAGRVVALGHLHLRVQPSREALGHRALPPRRDRAGDPALPLADPLQPGEAPSRGEDHGPRRPREGPGEAVRPLQDGGMVDRHLVDERGDDRRADLPRRRHAHRPAVPEDDGRPPRREGREALRPGLRVHRPGRTRHVALPRSRSTRPTTRRRRPGSPRPWRGTTPRWTPSSATR